MSVKYLQVSHLGHKDHLKQLHRQLSLYKLFVSSECLKFLSKTIPKNRIFKKKIVSDTFFSETNGAQNVCVGNFCTKKGFNLDG